MASTLQIRKPTVREIERLAAGLERESAGLQGTEIAVALGVYPNTVYADSHAFDEQALACLGPLSPGGAVSRFTPDQKDLLRFAPLCPHPPLPLSQLGRRGIDSLVSFRQ